jgi:hypothetical protein
MGAAFLSYKDTVRSLIGEPACLTWVKDKAVADIVHEFGGEVEEVAEGNFNDLYEGYECEEGERVVLISRFPGWSLIVEFNGYLGDGADVLRSLSSPGAALSLGWTIELDAGFSYAENGRILASFDPVRQGTDVADSEYLIWASALGVTPEEWREDWMAAAFAVAERLSGIRIDGDWKEGTYLLLRAGFEAEVEEEARPDLVLRDHMWELVSRHPRVAAVVAHPTEDKLTEITLITVETACRAAVLDGPVISEALRAVADGRRGAQVGGLQDELAAIAAGYQEQAAQVMDDQANVFLPDPDTGWGRLLMKHHAVKALMAPLRSDPYPGCLGALSQAEIVTASRRKEGDDYRLLTTLKVIAFYVFNGDNAIRLSP